MADHQNYVGKTVYDTNGVKLGTIKDLYLDDDEGSPKWVTITHGFFGTKQHFMPIEGLHEYEDGLQAPYTGEQLEKAPHIDADAYLDADGEERLYRHYHMSTSDDAMTRSEEELRVGKKTHETGRMRLRKYIVTERAQVEVPLEHEVARVEREPITDSNVGQAMEGPTMSEEEHEVVLHSERPVVDKEVMPKERVSLKKDKVQQQQPVFGEVRKEVVDEERDKHKGHDHDTER